MSSDVMLPTVPNNTVSSPYQNKITSADMPPPHLTLVASPALKDSAITLIPWQAYPEEDCNPTIPLCY